MYQYVIGDKCHQVIKKFQSNETLLWVCIKVLLILSNVNIQIHNIHLDNKLQALGYTHY